MSGTYPKALRWLLGAAALLVACVLALWLGTPAVVRHVLHGPASETLGRPVDVGDVSFNPFTLTLEATQLQVAGATPDDPPQASIARLRASLAWASLLHRAPVVDELRIDGPQLRVTRLAPGRYDINDLITRLTAADDQARAHAGPPRFAIRGVEIEGGDLVFDDRPYQRVHHVEALTATLPRLSTLDTADIETPAQPHLAFVLDGTRYDSGAATTPFDLSKRHTLSLHTGEVDLAPWLPYLPETLPVRPTTGALQVDLDLQYAQPDGGPTLRLSGSLALRDTALVARDGGRLATVPSLAVQIDELHPLHRQVRLGDVRLQGARVWLRRDADGALNWVRTLAADANAAPTAPPEGAVAAAESAASSTDAPASATAGAGTAPSDTPLPGWQIAVRHVDIAALQVDWRDETTGAHLALSDTHLSVGEVAWPMAEGRRWPWQLRATLQNAAEAADSPARDDTDRSVTGPIASTASGSTVPSTSAGTAVAASNRPAAAGTGGATPAPAASASASATPSTPASSPATPAGEAPATSTSANGASPAPDDATPLSPSDVPGTLQARGAIGADGSRVSLRLDHLTLALLRPYLRDVLVPHIDGNLSIEADAEWTGGPLDDGWSRARVNVPRLQVAELAVTEATSRDTPAVTDAARIAGWQDVTVTDSRIDLATRRIDLGALAISAPTVDLVRDRQGRLNVAAWVAPATATSAPTAASAAPAGRPVLRLDGATAPPTTTTADPAAPWQASLAQLTLRDGRVRWRDAQPPSGARDVALDLRSIGLTTGPLRWPLKPGAAAPLRGVALLVVPGTRTPVADIGWNGRLTPEPMAWDGRVRLRRLPLHALAPYLPADLPVRLAHGEAEWLGRVRAAQAADGWQVDVDGDAALSALALRAAGTDSELLRWRRLDVPTLALKLAPGQALSVSTGAATLDDFYASLIVTEDGRFNLNDLAAPAPPAGGASAAQRAAPRSAPRTATPGTPANTMDSEYALEQRPAADTPPPPAAPASAADDGLTPRIAVAGLTLSNGTIDFTDRFIRPNYSAALSQLNGRIGAFRSDAPEMAPIELEGKVAGTADLKLQGQLNPTANPLALDLTARATDLELTPFSPYAGKYVGYGIERGKLSMDVSYRIDPDGQLQARNQIVLNQLTFGDKVDSPDATKLPVRLAVALLTDRNGVIDLDLPIGGSINDPQFSIGGLIWKMFVNLIGKALTSPFSLLTGGGNGGGADLSTVAFVPGTARPAAGADAVIDKVAKALTDRPAMKLTLTPTADLAAEGDALRGALLEQRLMARWQEERREQGPPARPGGDADAGRAAAAPPDESASDALATATVDADRPPPRPTPRLADLPLADRTRLLEAQYDATDLPDKPRNFIGMTKDLPAPEMEARLKQAITPTSDDARALAQRRAEAVRDALLAKGLSNDRIFIAAPALGAAAGTSATAPDTAAAMQAVAEAASGSASAATASAPGASATAADAGSAKSADVAGVRLGLQMR